MSYFQKKEEKKVEKKEEKKEEKKIEPEPEKVRNLNIDSVELFLKKSLYMTYL